MTEIMPFQDVAESRHLVQADTDGLGVLLPESVDSKLGKRGLVQTGFAYLYASNETRMPPL